MTRVFEHALVSDRQAIVDALSHPNPFARAQTIGLLIKLQAFDPMFQEAVSGLIDDDEKVAFGIPVKNIANEYLALARSKQVLVI